MRVENDVGNLTCASFSFSSQVGILFYRGLLALLVLVLWSTDVRPPCAIISSYGDWDLSHSQKWHRPRAARLWSCDSSVPHFHTGLAMITPLLHIKSPARLRWGYCVRGRVYLKSTEGKKISPSYRGPGRRFSSECSVSSPAPFLL